MTRKCTYNDSYNNSTEIISLNNRAAVALVSGDIEYAISTFCRALHQSKSSFVTHDESTHLNQMASKRGIRYRNGPNNIGQSVISEQVSRQENSSSLKNQTSFDISHLMEAECFGLKTEEKRTGRISNLNHSRKKIKLSSTDSFTTAYSSRCEEEDICCSNDDICDEFIYQKPIHIPNSYVCNSALQISDVTLPSIVIFNLALSHHLWGMKMQNDDRACLLLKKAAKLYGLAIQLQEGQMVSEGPQSYSKLFFLSCINNLGNTHRLLGDEISSKMIYQQLLTMLMYLTYSEQHHGYQLSNNTPNVLSNSSLQRMPMPISTYSAGSTYGSFYRNIFQTDVNAAPAA